jgi:hypothetical protein
MSGGGGTNTTTQKSDPWVSQQPYLQDIFSQAQKQYQQPGPQYFPGQTLAPVQPQTQQAQTMAATAATGPMQNLANAGAWGSNYALTTAVDPANNPFFQSAVQGAIRPAVQAFTDAGGPLSQIRNDATSAGQYGGTRMGIGEGIATSRLQQQVLDTAAGMGNTAYNEGLTAQGRALAFLPGVQQTAAAPATTLDTVGQQVQQQQQNVINDAIARWNYQQTLPQQKLSQFQNVVQGQYGGQAVTQAPTPQGNPLMSGLGGAVGGYALGSALGGAANGAVYGPWGAAAGALIGLFGSRM